MPARWRGHSGLTGHEETGMMATAAAVLVLFS
jgi:hypothetical protein